MNKREDSGWCPQHSQHGDHDFPPGDQDALEVSVPVRIVGLGAICDLDRASADGRSVSFTVAEFVLLEDGRRLVLHRDRGFTVGWGTSAPDLPAISKSQTRESITRNVLNVVLPDEDDGEPHPWEWLAGLARAQGLKARAQELRDLPYHVILTEETTRILALE